MSKFRRAYCIWLCILTVFTLQNASTWAWVIWVLTGLVGSAGDVYTALKAERS